MSHSGMAQRCEKGDGRTLSLGCAGFSPRVAGTIGILDLEGTLENVQHQRSISRVRKTGPE